MDFALSWVDLAFVALLLLSALLGLWRGLVFEVLSLAGWVIAYFGAPYAAPYIAAWLPQEKMGPSLLHVVSLVLAFLLILVIWGLAAKLVRALIHATPLSIVDRLLGGGFGLLRGALLALLLVVIVSMTPVVKSTTWQASVLAPKLQDLLQAMRPVLPADVVKLIPA